MNNTKLNPVCEKCGEDHDLRLVYKHSIGVAEECMQVHCGRCKYRWVTDILEHTSEDETVTVKPEEKPEQRGPSCEWCGRDAGMCVWVEGWKGGQNMCDKCFATIDEPHLRKVISDVPLKVPASDKVEFPGEAATDLGWTEDDKLRFNSLLKKLGRSLEGRHSDNIPETSDNPMMFWTI